MQELIKLNTDANGIETVNARDLHTFLESKREFATWIKERIDSFGFKEDEDFTINKFVIGRATQIDLIDKFVNNPKGGRPTLDYHLTLDMAKELSMVERNDKGKQARQYFIECERKLKINNVIDFSNPEHLIPLLTTYAQNLQIANVKIKKQDVFIAKQAPKVRALERITKASGSKCITDTAKELNIKRDDLSQFLEKSGWIFKRRDLRGVKFGSWLPHQTKIDRGYLELKSTHITRGLNDKEYLQTLIKPKGKVKISEMLAKADIAIIT